ncbi:MAG: hypothetical protein WC337_00940 [Candidatus Muiribacteriota bacterium]
MKFFNKKALSFIEIMIAVSYFALVLIPFVALLVNSTRQIQKIGNMNVAIMLAQEAIEACKGYPFELLDKDDAVDAKLDEKLYLEYAFSKGVRKGTTSIADYDGTAEKSDLTIYTGDDEDIYWRAAKFYGVWFTRDVEIIDVEADTISKDEINLKQVRVNVTWKSGSKDLVYTVSTVIGK